MKLLQAIIAVLTVILFLIRQNCTFAGVNPAKKQCVHGRPGYCGDSRLASSSFVSSDCQMCRRCSSLSDDEDFSMPKYKKDPKITVDNEDIDDYPVDN